MIKNFPQALHYLRRHVPNSKNRFPGDLGLNRQKEILKLLDNPQNKIKTIHIAGTSGKGSTAFFISKILVAHKFKVGLTLSPHILDIRERFQINNKFVSKKEFVFYLNQIIPVIEKIKKTNLGSPTFFEILIALSFYIFHQKKVDYAVVETGLGGLMDGTNSITSLDQVVVFTKIGLDHTNILGKNLSSIAAQKAGIIHNQNHCLSLWQVKSVRDIFDKTAAKNKTNVDYIKPKINYKKIHLDNQKIIYDFSFQNVSISKLKINTFALYQVENSALSLAVLTFLSQRDNFKIEPSFIRKVFLNFNFPGRMDVFSLKNKQKLILDGAHNPQKMKAVIASLKKAFPNQKFVFVLAFKQRRDFRRILKYLIPVAKKIIITSFLVTSQDMTQKSQPINSLTSFFKTINFSNYQIISQPQQALHEATESSQSVVVTGSLYLLNEIYPLLHFSRRKN